MKPDGTPDVQDILAQVDTLWPWEKEQLLDKLLTREMLQVKVGQMSAEEINDYTGLYCYENERKEPEDLKLEEVMKYFCTSDIIEELIKKGKSMTMLAIMGEKGVLKEKNVIVVSDLHLKLLYVACKNLRSSKRFQQDESLIDLISRIENTMKKEG